MNRIVTQSKITIILNKELTKFSYIVHKGGLERHSIIVQLDYSAFFRTQS